MHIPDGLLSTPVWATTDLLAIAALVGITRRSQQTFNEKTIPLTGIMCAFIFAAQMINFPVMAGTSGHLLGGVLAAVFLGPWVGGLVLSLVLIVQCFLFQDGGLYALGANILNMAVVGVGVGYIVFKIGTSLFSDKAGFFFSVSVASWVSVVAAAAVCSVELGLSGTYPLGWTLAAMLPIHALIGIGEALISTLIVSSVLGLRPDLLPYFPQRVTT